MCCLEHFFSLFLFCEVLVLRSGFVCCRCCRSVFVSEADYFLHLGLSLDGSRFCRGGAGRVVSEIGKIVSNWRLRR